MLSARSTGVAGTKEDALGTYPVVLSLLVNVALDSDVFCKKRSSVCGGGKQKPGLVRNLPTVMSLFLRWPFTHHHLPLRPSTAWKQKAFPSAGPGGVCRPQPWVLPLPSWISQMPQVY